MTKKISKKATKLIEEFENNVDHLSYCMYSEYGTDSAKAHIEKDLSYSKLVNYILKLETTVADYKRATIKGE